MREADILNFRKKVETFCKVLIYCTVLKSSHRVLYRLDRSSCRIFQFLFIPEDPNLTLSSRMLKLILSMACMRLRCSFSAWDAKRLPCMESSGTRLLSITPAF